jgi:glycosyltransferase involved in cell wall biosynthesis
VRILHIVPSYKPAFRYGGTIVSVSRLAEEQRRAGADVQVFTTTANGAEELAVPVGMPLELNSVQIWYFRRWTGDHGHFSPALLWATWRNALSFQVVHIHSWWNWVAFGAALICRLRHVRAVVTPHGMLSPYTVHGRLRLFFQKTLGNFLLAKSLLHATSKQEMWELQALHPGIAVVMVPNIVYLPEYIPEHPDTGMQGLQLLFLSRIDPKKGVDILLRALAGLKDIPGWRLNIAGATGTPYQKKMQALAASLGLYERIIWSGWIQGNDKWNLLAGADLLILPSHNENFAIAVLEALAVGTPVVVGNKVGLHSYVAENDFGWRTDITPEALAKALREAFADEAKRRRIHREAPERVRADFEPGRIVQEYFRKYRRIDSIDSIDSNIKSG